MKWYNWIAIFLICISGFIWSVVPGKPIWVNVILIGIMVAGVMFVKHMPDKILEKGEK